MLIGASSSAGDITIIDEVDTLTAPTIRETAMNEYSPDRTSRIPLWLRTLGMALIVLLSAFAVAALVGFLWYFSTFMVRDVSGPEGAVGAVMTLTAWLRFLALPVAAGLLVVGLLIARSTEGQPGWVGSGVAAAAGALIALGFPVIDEMARYGLLG